MPPPLREETTVSDTLEQALIPIEQAAVSFYGRDIIAVRLADGRIAAALRTMCDALQLDRPGQLRRIREDEVLADQLVPVRVETDGGSQVMEMLTAWAIPTWLTGIQLKRVAPDKRAAILAFKREAADALYRHFSHPQAALAAPTSLVPSEPITKPSVPPQDAPPDVWLQYHQQMITFIQWQGDVERWRGAVESRLESVEEVTRLVPEILERLGPQTLTPEHQATIKHQAARLHEVSGLAYATVYGDLNAAFHVARYSDIADARWPEIAAWFKTRLDAAEKRERGQG
jgi:antirepressor protein